MIRRPAHLLILLALSACVVGESATDVREGERPGALAPQPALIPSASDATALPINRIRAVAYRDADAVVIGRTEMEVSPTADQWEVLIAFDGDPGPGTFSLDVFLLNVSSDGTESVEFSGRAGPLQLVGSEPLEPDVPIVRGPIANLYVTGVSIEEAPDGLVEGTTQPLLATVSTSASTAPTIYWTSLAPGVVTMTDSTATAIAPGVALVVASAGAFADTVAIRVTSSDVTGPTVVSTSPAADAPAAARGGNVTATFDELLDPASVTAETFTLLDAQGVPVSGSVSYAGLVATFDPAAPLEPQLTYTATLTTGIRDPVGNALAAPYTWTFTTSDSDLAVVASFSTVMSVLIAVAVDPNSGNLFLYDDFTSAIQEFTPAGDEVLPAIPSPGITANDYDLDFLDAPATVGGEQVPAGTLLVMNGEIQPRTVYALDPDDGTVLASVETALTDPVGLSYHPARGTAFAIDWTGDIVSEIDLATGETLTTFPVVPPGAPAWTVFYGDVEVEPETGFLLLVSSDQPVVRVMEPTGVFIRDFSTLDIGISGMSGIAWDNATSSAWIASTTGFVWRVSGILENVFGAPPPAPARTGAPSEATSHGSR